MTEENRIDIVSLEFEKARRFLTFADRMLAEGEYEIAANRYYYACYHAVQGLFINDGLHSHTHRGLHQKLGMYYLKTGKISADLCGMFRTMEQLREKADYNCSYSVSMQEVEEMKDPSHKLIDVTEALVKQTKN